MGKHLRTTASSNKATRLCVAATSAGVWSPHVGSSTYARAPLAKTPASQSGNVSGEVTPRRGFIDNDQPAGLLNRIQNRFLIHGAGGSEINQIATNTVFFQRIAGLFCPTNHQSGRNNRRIAAGANFARMAERNGVITFGHFA